MRTLQRTLVGVDRALLRDAATIAAAMVAVGASFGTIAIAYGLPAYVPFLMSTVVFAGGAQFLAVGLLAAGNPLAAVLAGLLLNARHLPFGLAVSTAMGTRKRDRIVGSHLMTDEVVAFTLAEPDPVRRRRTYWLIGCTLFTSWNLGTALGVLLGGVTGDPGALGADAAFPAALIALIMPSLRDRATRTVALTGAAIAVLLTPVLPAGLPVMCALLGLFTLFRPRGPRAGSRPALPPAPEVGVPPSPPAGPAGPPSVLPVGPPSVPAGPPSVPAGPPSVPAGPLSAPDTTPPAGPPSAPGGRPGDKSGKSEKEPHSGREGGERC